MSHPAPNTSLSLSTRLLCYLGPPSVILITSAGSPRTAALSPIAFLPTALFYTKWRRSNEKDPSSQGELQQMIWTYAITGTLGIAAVAIVQLVICSATSTILFGHGTARKIFWTELQRRNIDGLTVEELSRRTKLALSWQNWVFNSVFTFFAAGLGEEALKYLPIAYARRRSKTKPTQRRRNRAYLDYAVAGALGFGTLENIGFIYAACEHGLEKPPKLMLTLFERTIFGSFGHLLTAALTALRATRRDYYGDPLNWWAVVAPSVLFHGSYDFLALSFSAWEGNVGWIHPSDIRTTTVMLGMATGMVATLAWLVRREWKMLGDRDRRVK